MKRIICLFLMLTLLLSIIGASAAGKLSVDQENFHVVSGYWTYGYAYAKVSNTGDKPIKVNAGILEIYDNAGDVITSQDYMSSYAEYLQPGEYTYIKISDEIKDADKGIVAADYMLTITGKSSTSKISKRLPVKTDLELNVQSGWWTYNYMYVTITNNTEAPIYGIDVVIALLDADGNILYIDDDSLTSSRALTPGSSIIIREDISSSFIDYFADNNLIPVTVDAIAYIDIDM